ncbi:MAG: hypothetical protein QOI03_2276 [Solirubrobacteraceae bacterium]|jgi:uncharacterized protein (DUF58 family)|nr:hypothetical protein [Solirubrobacteraceae bacterium]
MTPTTRCAAIVAAVALSAIVLPTGVSIAALLVVLGATLVDAVSVRVPPRIRRTVATSLSRGEETTLAVDAVAADSRRVLLRQPASAAVGVSVQAGERQLRGTVLPRRRGRQTLPGVASASLGPLGLARWHHPAGEPLELQVYPNMVRARELTLRLRAGRAALDGRLRRGPLGLGTDFDSVRDYSPDDDVRQVNWRATSRLGRPMSNQYRVEQDHDVVCVLDAGRLMGAPTGHGTLLDVALDAVAAVALATDELGDRCGAVAFDAEIRRHVAPRRLGGRRVLNALFDLQPTGVDSDFERAFLSVGGSRRGLVIVLTDLIDERAARSLLRAAPMLTRRHAVVVAGVRDGDLDSAVGASEEDSARALAAASVLREREAAGAKIRRLGAEVSLAPAELLAKRCVQAYLRAKARVRL